MDEAIMIVKARLEKAEADLKACGKGSNYGRVNELRALLLELYEKKGV